MINNEGSANETRFDQVRFEIDEYPQRITVYFTNEGITGINWNTNRNRSIMTGQKAEKSQYIRSKKWSIIGFHG